MSVNSVAMRWVDGVDAALINQVGRVVNAVIAQGGAVGWLQPLELDEVEHWLLGWAGSASDERAGLVSAVVDGRVEAIGGWRSGPDGVVGHVVEFVKVMAHPDARGLGLGRRVVDELIAATTELEYEIAVLGVRGNNHGAIAVYEDRGFRVWGALPDGIAVGDHRFDDVRMYRRLRVPTSTTAHGSAPGGAGGSARRP